MADYIMDLRRVVGARPLIVPGAVVIVYGNEGKVLLHRRGDNGCWGFPGGVMELGESFEDTARREVFEETGLCVGEVILLGLLSGKDTFYEYPNGHQVYDATAIFAASVVTGVIQPDGRESLDINFFDSRVLPQNISPPDAAIFQKFVLHFDD